MINTVSKLTELLESGKLYFSSTDENILSLKVTPEKWSKKEILGHLIDSAINNLQRFTEIQFSEKPFQIRRYNQNELVIANDYQHADKTEILSLWLALNNRIIEVIKTQDPTTLNFQILLPDGQTSDLEFLMNDYVVHLEHHLKQIITD